MELAITFLDSFPADRPKFFLFVNADCSAISQYCNQQYRPFRFKYIQVQVFS